MINATLRKLKYSELYERLFDQESDKESPTSLYNILLLAAIIGCMAIDTSICERGFSLMNMLKTAKRSRMGIPLLRMLMKPARSARCGRIRARSPRKRYCGSLARAGEQRPLCQLIHLGSGGAAGRARTDVEAAEAP